MTSSAEQIRAWQGPALLSYGFRPLFLLGGGWAALAMGLWLGMLTGQLALPTAFDPVSWHAHELIWGYLAATLAGFMLTAVPNWTGRLPIVGYRLGGLAALWAVGRIAVAFSAALPAWLVAVLDIAFLATLAAAIGREIVGGHNWKNAPVLGLLVALIAGDAVFHWEAANGRFAAGGVGARIGIAVAVLMIALIGGRIIPSFTRNWLARRGPGRLPVPFARFDKLCLAVTLVTLFGWIAVPGAAIVGAFAGLTALLQAVRLWRWAGWRTGAEPLVWILHAGYAFVPLGFLLLAGAILLPGSIPAPAAVHAFMVGAVAVMTLAVMTRATLGHTGRPLGADRMTTVLYGAILVAAAARIAAAFWPAARPLLDTAGGAWIVAFGLFVFRYGPILMTPRL